MVISFNIITDLLSAVVDPRIKLNRRKQDGRNKVMNIELTPEMFEKLDDSKKNSEKIAYESKTYIADAWNRFKKNKLALIGLCFYW